MDPFVQALIMGVVQGLTEFLPISSSGHLIVLPALLGWSDPLIESLRFSVVLHVGTLLALVLTFARDWIALLGALVGLVRARSLGTDPHRRLVLHLAVATVPAAIAGFLLNDFVESTVREPLVVAALLLVGGAILLVADRFGSKVLGVDALRTREAFVIGCAQALALFPGLSRSGISISAGLLVGLDRSAAARFSFLMATPIIAGAGLFEVRALLGDGAVASGDPVELLAAGFLAAFVSGLVAIRFLLRYLRTNSLAVFVVYRVLLALVILGALAWR